MDLPKSVHKRDPEAVDPMTGREVEILELLSDGWTNVSIAERLFLSLETIKWYNKRIYSKLGVKNRTQAVKKARELGLLGANSLPKQSEDAGRRHNLPAATTPFVGREIELGELADLLADEHIRLVTILAAGGMGKTRLALEAAKSQIPNFRNGVFFVPLTQLRSDDDIIPMIAASLDVQLSSTGDPTTELATYLRSREMLFVLDNFEHLLNASSVVTTLLETAPEIKIIATSRERLNLRGEIVYALGGMALPSGSTHAETLNCSSVQLFLQGMQMARAHAAVSEDELQSVRQICRQVGGMPLGIQLASSLVDVLSPGEIAEEIERGIDILTTEMRDMPPRLRSVRAVFDYSWSRLTRTERDVFMQLAVFRAGFTREAAQTLAGANVRILKTLVNKSLIQWAPDVERYSMHELLRQYAEEQLLASELSDTAYRAHTSYYLDLMARCEAGIKGNEQLGALNQIEADFDNIRSAWLYAVEQGDADAIDRSLEALYWYCRMRARVPAGETLFHRARGRFEVSFSPDASPFHRRLLLRFDSAGESFRTEIERMLTLVRTHGTPREVAFFLWMLGFNRYLSSDFVRAVVSLEEAVTRFQDLNDDFYRADALHWLSASKRFLGQKDEVNTHTSALRVLCRRTGNRFALARVLGRQGIYGVFEDDNVQARKDLEEAIAIREELGDRAGKAISLVGLSFDAFFQGDLSRAHKLAEESRALTADSNSLFPQAIALGVLGWVAAVEQDYDKAWELCYESMTLTHDPNLSYVAQFGLALAGCGRERYDAARENVRAFFQSVSPLHTNKGFLSFLPVLAIVYASQGKHERAVEIFALAFTHESSPSKWMKQWKLLDHWQTRLEQELGQELYEAAWKRGAKMELGGIIHEFLSLEATRAQGSR